MSENSMDITDADPFEITQRASDTNNEFIRFEATVHPDNSGDTASEELEHERFLLDNPDEHIHPHQKEVVEVISGEYTVGIAGTDHHLTGGDSITIPANTPHRHRNPSPHPIRVAHEHHPPRDSVAFGEAMYALAQAGKTNEKGMPNMLQFAVLTQAFPGIAYTTDAPIPVQKALTAVLAPVGRLIGYDAAPEQLG